MIISLIFIIIIFYFLYINSNFNINKKRPPSPITFPIIGNLIPLFFNQCQYKLNQYYKIYGPIYQLQYGSVNTVVLSEYEILKETFIDNADIFIERFNKQSKKFKSSENIVNSNGIVWEKLHSIAIKELMPNIKIKKYEPMIIDEANKLVEVIKKQYNIGESFDPTLNIKICFLNIILNFLFNFKYEDYKNEKAILLVDNIHKIFRMGSNPVIYDYIPIVYKIYSNFQTKQHQNIFNELYTFINEMANNKLELINKYYLENKDQFKPNCFAEILILKYKSNELTWNEVIKTITDILIAGSDTNALFSIHLIIALTNRKEIQDKVYNEIKNNIIDNNETISYSNKLKTPYFNSVLKETERRYTVSPLSQPHQTNKDVWIRGYFIPSGSQIIQNVYSSHLNNKNWDNPFEFIPERFLNDNNTNNISLEKKLLTFGIGPRNCLGFQFALLSVYLVNIILFKSFKFESSNHIQEEYREPGTTLSPFPFKLNYNKR